MKKILPILLLFISLQNLSAQGNEIMGYTSSNGEKVPFVNVYLKEIQKSTISDTNGYFRLSEIPNGAYTLMVSGLGYDTYEEPIEFPLRSGSTFQIELSEKLSELDEVVVTGTLKEVNRMESPVPVEVYNAAFFRKNPVSCVFDAVQGLNGVRPQLNCNVCNTGDIHINGLEGAYTMILIDGMPIVSGLSSVYGLSGIPNSLIERIEVVKGPASSLYGSEAIGGLINVITKKIEKAPLFSADVFTTSWMEYNADLGLKINFSKKIQGLSGINYFNYQNPRDNNGDNFTDLTLQHRLSLFEKINVQRKENRIFSLAARYFYEDRWGGQMQWSKEFRGGDSIYGESIYTHRWELIGNYQLPLREKMLLSFSVNQHEQNSAYGNTFFIASQWVGFAQLTWDKKTKHHDLLAGTALRYTGYDDNTVATAKIENNQTINQPQKTFLPGIFFQDEIKISPAHTILLGLRYDYNTLHGNILTPRFAYKWKFSPSSNLRLNIGTGFRVVNLFTEEHAALTGARKIVLKDQLKPEQSISFNLNWTQKILNKEHVMLNAELSSWYTRFSNRIIANYDLDPNLIYFDNLQGYAVSRGMALNLDFELLNRLKLTGGLTWMDVYKIEESDQGEKIKTNQILTEHWTGTWALSYSFPRIGLSVDYTGNFYGPMRLPLLGPLDPRKEYSPLWSIQNIQFTWKPVKESPWELYAGVKNLLNYTPPANSIARSFDPFDKKVLFDSQGQVIPTMENPYAQTFDTNYVYASNQGIRCFLGLRYTIR